MATRKRNLIIAGAAFVVAAVVGFGLSRESTGAEKIVVYKTATCGCCGKWVEHMEAAGYQVEVNDVSDLTGIKNLHRVPAGLRTCHTGIVNGYTVEGHVPAEFVTRLLKEKPDVAGIGVPGMPVGSPGMEGEYRASYDVLAFNRDGRTAVYGHVEGDPGR